VESDVPGLTHPGSEEFEPCGTTASYVILHRLAPPEKLSIRVQFPKT